MLHVHLANHILPADVHDISSSKYCPVLQSAVHWPLMALLTLKTNRFKFAATEEC